MTQKTRLIYSSDIDELLGGEEEQRPAYEDFLEINNLPSSFKEDEGRFQRYLDDTMETYLEDTMTEIEFHEKRHGIKHYLVVGTLGLWNGTRRGGAVIQGLANAIRMCFEDYTRVYQEGRRLCVEAAHHDGTNHFTIYELTPSGLEWYCNNEGRLSREEICETLLKRKGKMVCNVELFNRVFGWMKPLRKEN